MSDNHNVSIGEFNSFILDSAEKDFQDKNAEAAIVIGALDGGNACLMINTNMSRHKLLHLLNQARGHIFLQGETTDQTKTLPPAIPTPC
jgi:hypothetical protein